jgi:cytochrome c oxidase assembly factor CtaG
LGEKKYRRLVRENPTRATMPTMFTRTALQALLLICALGAIAFGILVAMAINNAEQSNPLWEIELLVAGLIFTVAVGCGLIAAGQEKR